MSTISFGRAGRWCHLFDDILFYLNIVREIFLSLYGTNRISCFETVSGVALVYGFSGAKYRSIESISNRRTEVHLKLMEYLVKKIEFWLIKIQINKLNIGKLKPLVKKRSKIPNEIMRELLIRTFN